MKTSTKAVVIENWEDNSKAKLTGFNNWLGLGMNKKEKTKDHLEISILKTNHPVI